MNATFRAFAARALVFAFALAPAGCRKSAPEPPAIEDDAGPRSRIFEPPPGQVRAVWPHEIRADGIGPYLLGASLEEIFDVLPGGPRIEILQVEGVANYNLVRAEGQLLVIGASRRGPVEFIAVVGEEVARTASGAGVGASLEQLDEAMGEPLQGGGSRASDPRVRSYRGLPGVRFLLGNGKVEAVLTAVGAPATDDDAPTAGAKAAAPGTDDGCARDLAAPERGEFLTFAGLNADAPVQAGCFFPGGTQLLTFDDKQVAVHSRRGAAPGPGKVARLPVAGLVYAAPLDIDGDERDEIVAVTRTTGETTLEYGVVVIRVDPARLGAVASESLYEVTRIGAALTGAELPEVDLYIELARSAEGRGARLEVGGVYVHRERGAVRDAAPLLPRSVDFRRRRPSAAKAVESSADDDPRQAGPEPGRLGAGSDGGDADAADEPAAEDGEDEVIEGGGAP